MNDKYLREHTPSLDDIIFTRREFLVRTGMGIRRAEPRVDVRRESVRRAGATTATGQNRVAAVAEAAALPGQGQVGHSHLRRRRAVARRYVGSEAGAGEVRRTRRSPVTTASRIRRRSSSRRWASRASRSARSSRSSAKCVDDMAVIRSMWTDIPAHDVAQRFMNTGSLQLPKPSHRLVGGLRARHREPEHARLHHARRQAGVAAGVVPARASTRA